MTRFDRAVTLVMLAIFVAMVAVASTYPADARFMPFVIGFPAILLCLLQVAADWRAARRGKPLHDATPGEGDEIEFGASTLTAEITTWAYFVGFVTAVLLFGFLASVPVMVSLYLWREAQLRPVTALMAGCGFALAIHLMFERLLTFRLHEGFLTERLLDALAS